MVTEAGDRIKEGLEEALAVAKGERPAAVIHVDGNAYVPKVELDAALRWRDAENSALNVEFKRAEKMAKALAAIIDRSHNGELGTSKVIDMRNIALEALGDANLT